jgi:rhodanese-related sulfurtransferase
MANSMDRSLSYQGCTLCNILLIVEPSHIFSLGSFHVCGTFKANYTPLYPLWQEHYTVNSSPFINLSNAELLTLIATTPTLQLLDVRTPNEFMQLGHIVGTQNRPVQLIQEWASTLDTTKPVALICQGGVRSVYACDYLANQGFNTLYNLTDGMKAWEGELSFGPDETLQQP